MKRFYNTPFEIYTLWSEKVRGTVVGNLTLLYSWKCAFWWNTKKYGQTSQSVQTNQNDFEVNIPSEFSWVKIWDVIKINWETYKILNTPIPHENFKGKIDNYQFFINITNAS
jgi:hypothetical protein